MEKTGVDDDGFSGMISNRPPFGVSVSGRGFRSRPDLGLMHEDSTTISDLGLTDGLGSTENLAPTEVRLPPVAGWSSDDVEVRSVRRSTDPPMGSSHPLLTSPDPVASSGKEDSPLTEEVEARWDEEVDLSPGQIKGGLVRDGEGGLVREEGRAPPAAKEALRPQPTDGLRQLPRPPEESIPESVTEATAGGGLLGGVQSTRTYAHVVHPD
ncbi:hypothetical protein Dimus_010664 [Dionaea muscipula]